MKEIIMQILQWLFTCFGGPFIKQKIHKGRLWIFHFRNRKPPLDELKVRKIAYSVLSGSIMLAIPYRNLNSKHVFIAVAHRESKESFDKKISILEQFGKAFRTIWESERPLLHISQFQVADIDEDGTNEVIFTTEEYGTGAYSKRMFVYSTVKKQLFELCEDYDNQNLAGPVSPQIDVNPKSDEDFIEAIEHYAVEQGFLQTTQTVDFDSPDFAVQRWHVSNGTKMKGAVKLHFYSDKPRWSSSISATLETDDILWIAYFKGPLFGYIKSKNQHFVAFSPSWKYNWVKCLTYDGENLWFGIISVRGILSFKFDQVKGDLNYYNYFKDKLLPEVEKIQYDSGVITVNNKIKIPVDTLQKLGTHIKISKEHIE